MKLQQTINKIVTLIKLKEIQISKVKGWLGDVNRKDEQVWEWIRTEEETVKILEDVLHNLTLEN